MFFSFILCLSFTSESKASGLFLVSLPFAFLLGGGTERRVETDATRCSGHVLRRGDDCVKQMRRRAVAGMRGKGKPRRRSGDCV